MSSQTHGAVAILLTGTAIVTAGLAILLNGSPLLVLVYAGITAISTAVILYFYCRKCYARTQRCSHLKLGSITTLFPRPAEGGYTLRDYIFTALALVLMITFPQYWIFQRGIFIIIFWTTLTGAITEIYLFVCRGCKNGICPMCPGYQKQKEQEG